MKETKKQKGIIIERKNDRKMKQKKSLKFIKTDEMSENRSEIFFLLI